MPNATPRRLALNIPLIVLWVASIAVGAIGLWQLRAGNAGQADFYNSGGSDYLTFLDLQTQSTIGGMLLIAGIVGVLVALAVHARNRAAAIVAREAAATVTAVDEFDELDEFEDDDTEAGEVPAAAEVPADDSAAPSDEPAAEASAAVAETEAPGADTETAAAPVESTDEAESAASDADRAKN